jgi:hypothetical protein
MSLDPIAEHKLRAEMLAAEHGMAYCQTPPSDDEVPADLIVTHNRVAWAGHAFGEAGFRSWVEPASRRDRRHLCACAWGRPALSEHYTSGQTSAHARAHSR